MQIAENISYYSSSYGIWQIVADNKKLLRIEIVKEETENVVPNHITETIADNFHNYFKCGTQLSTKFVDFTQFTPLKKSLYKALLMIPCGKTVSYQNLAFLLSSHPRAIGSLLGKNPFPLVIPCHRVIRTDGNLGGFALGVNLKKALIAHELKILEQK